MKCLSTTIRKILPLPLALAVLTLACSKSSNSYSTPGGNGKAFLAVTNASAGISGYNVYSGTTMITAAGQVNYGSTTGTSANPYLNYPSGMEEFRISSNGTSYPVDSNFNFVANQYYSVFVYDTIGSSGKLRALILSDTHTAPPSGKAGLRFINLSPNISAENVLLVNGKDTTIIMNNAYAGLGTLSPDSAQTFRVFPAGTYALVVTDLSKTMLWSTTSLNLASGNNYTIYSRGYEGGIGMDSLTTGVIQD